MTVAPSTVEFPGVGEPFRSRFSGNPDRFRVREFADACGTQFAAETGTFHTAEWQTRIGRDHRVDENHSAVQVRYETFLLLGIFGPRARIQAEWGVVRELDGRFYIAKAPALVVQWS